MYCNSIEKIYGVWAWSPIPYLRTHGPKFTSFKIWNAEIYMQVLDLTYSTYQAKLSFFGTKLKVEMEKTPNKNNLSTCPQIIDRKDRNVLTNVAPINTAKLNPTPTENQALNHLWAIKTQNTFNFQ